MYIIHLSDTDNLSQWTSASVSVSAIAKFQLHRTAYTTIHRRFSQIDLAVIRYFDQGWLVLG